MFIHLHGSGPSLDPSFTHAHHFAATCRADRFTFQMHFTRFFIIALVSTLALQTARADHGPGTSGGGASTLSGETLKPGKFSADVRWDFTEFKDLSADEVARKAERAGSIDLLDRSSVYGLSLAYGVVENFQLSLSIGYYNAVRSREAEGAGDEEEPAADDAAGGEDEAGEKHHGPEYTRSNPDGLTDLLLTGKFRVYRGPLGQLALIGGVKIPTGRDEVRNNVGEPLEPSAAAGTGSWDFAFGAAYSRFLTPRLTLDASALYALRTEAHDFRLGNRFDAGVALAYRFTEDIEHYPQVAAFVEANVRHLAKSKDMGESDRNTGGTALFVSPGVRVGFSKSASFTVAPQIPIVQALNGEQLETEFRIITSFNLTF